MTTTESIQFKERNAILLLKYLLFNAKYISGKTLSD